MMSELSVIAKAGNVLKNSNDGIAYIKEQYIVPVDQLKKEDKTLALDVSEVKNFKNEFPNKKKKTGKNQYRPKLIREPPQKKLCRNLWCIPPGENVPEKCHLEKCCFSHDVAGFLDKKSQDISDSCHNFLTYGYCPYGVVCRYGSSHINSNGSVVDDEKYKTFKNNPSVKNFLKKEVQVSLRKRRYDFSKAMRASMHLSNPKDGIKGKIETSPVVVQNISMESESKLTAVSTIKEDKENLDTLLNENKVEASSVETEPPRLGPANDEDLIPLRQSEMKKINWKDKLYLAPLTTLGNLPYRRICKRLGAEVTCSEMAVSTCLLQGSSSEWALVKRHESEDCFGVQLCGSNVDAMIKCAQLLNDEVDMDFVDINMGCPIDLIYKQGGGSALMRRTGVLSHMVEGMTQVLSCPITLKMRTGVYRDTQVAHTIIEKAKLWDVSLITVHGRSKEQRYLKSSDWEYIKRCSSIAEPVPLFGNGDILTYDEYVEQKKSSNVAGIMIARGALIKPWIFTEIKEQRTWDISATERMDFLKEFTNNGLEHWGSDSEGVEKTRRFLLEWLSFLYRYIPVGIMERPQKINQRPPVYIGRNDLETLMASSNVKDWIKISEMLLGPVPNDFAFLPKHKANSWS